MEKLAEEKQTVITGGNVNYYLINVTNSINPSTPRPYVCEVGDLITALDMRFDEGTILKSLVRLCKLRTNLGKPGSNAIYEAEKIKYTADQLLIITARRGGNKNKVITDYIIDVPYPKRNKPYVCDVRDIFSALDMTFDEGKILKNLIKVCKLRENKIMAAHEAQKLKIHAENLLITTKSVVV